MSDIVLLVYPGFFCALFGGIIAINNLAEWQLRRRFRTTQTQSIVDTPGNSIVKIHGKVCPSEKGLVRVPLLDKDVVLYRLTVSKLVPTRTTSNWAEIHGEAAEHPFLVDDGSGLCAVVRPEGGKWLVDKKTIASSGLYTEPSVEFRAYLDSLGIESRGMDYSTPLRCEVQCIAPDDMVFVVGPSFRAAHGSSSVYRANAAPLVVAVDDKSREPLYFSNQSDATLTAVAWKFHCGWVGFIAGVLMFLFGLHGICVETGRRFWFCVC